MTLQQLKYILAIDRHRNFARAAEACGISQPTLSSMLQKLEDELDTRLFDRTNKSVTTTAIGRLIVGQAERVVVEMEKISDIVNNYKGNVNGHLNLSIGPTIAPYIIPRFIKIYAQHFPHVELTVTEMKIESMLDACRRGQTDIAIGISDNPHDGLLEIPLYTEHFWVYASAEILKRMETFSPEKFEHEKMWVMKEAQCMRESAFSFCKARSKSRKVYEAGSISTLVRIVDENGGFTIIPEMHIPLLTDKQRDNIRPISGNLTSCRKISIYIREDFIRQAIMDSVVHSLADIIPRKMLEPRILAHGVRLH